MTRRWTLRLVAGLAASAVVLSGCSDRQEASGTLPEADASPSASESDLPPLGPPDLPMPAEARTQDAAGAEAFVRYYIDLINRTSTVMDAAPLREFSEGCESCNRIATRAEEAAAAGEEYKGGRITITQVGEPLLSSGAAEMTLRIDQDEFVILDKVGLPTDGGSSAFSNALGGVRLSWDANRQSWLMTGLTFQ